ncbi:7-carboxy-7-deazaguanine synthase [Verrucomicrobia bacterium]|nr:7-carboxy-7-deazaguanine synthase [Verrucomicrobiota bacterium]
MLISEIFYSLQGEGELTGVPSVFIRTSGCNLRCNWCDTMYASWQPEGDPMSVDEILRKVDSFPAAQHCVLTGGEPMVAKGIHELAAALKSSGKHITIETAATIPPAGIVCDLASLSPKLTNSTPDARLSEAWRHKHEELRVQPAVVADWIAHYPYQLKFVITSEADLQEIQLLLAQFGREIPPVKILLMPEGTSSKAIRERDETLVDACKRYGYRYCDRLHVELFGHTRGT